MPLRVGKQSFHRLAWRVAGAAAQAKKRGQRPLSFVRNGSQDADQLTLAENDMPAYVWAALTPAMVYFCAP